MAAEPKFVVATPARTVCDNHARALERHGLLRFLALGTRRGVAGVSSAHTRLNPAIGLAAYIAVRTYPSKSEAFRFGLLPYFDRWVRRQLQPGDHIISSYGYVNASFEAIREGGGKTLIDAGNSHPENYWAVMLEEHARWGCPLPPFPRNWYQRSLEMMPLVDYVLSPSSYVTNSFLTRGFSPQQILRSIYPVDLGCFQPAPEPRPKDRPLTLISTGATSLRKGTPYLLEAFRLLRRVHPSARLLLSGPPHASLVPLLPRYADLPIEWAQSLPHPLLAERLRSADIFVLPSLEEGLVRALEAMACGLPVVLTSHCGADDFVEPGINGEIVPLRDPPAIVEAIVRCFERLLAGERPAVANLHRQLSYATFEEEFMGNFRRLNLAPQDAAPSPTFS